METYFYIHQKLEAVNNVRIINENYINREFIYIRVRGSLPIIAQNGNVIEALEETRKNVSYQYFIKKFVKQTLNFVM